MKYNSVIYYVLVIFFFLYFIIKVNAQETRPIINASLIGHVLDSVSQDPIEGANIQLAAVTHYVRTDQSGAFQFVTGQKLPVTLIISAIGYETLTLVVTDSPVLIALKPAEQALDEVVVVGYGSFRRRDLTGAVASLPDALLKQQVSSIDQALKGGVSGVQVTQTSGQPGGGVSIRIRGGASIQGGNEPLYVIDGFPLYNQVEQTGVGSGTAFNPLGNINPSDVESMEVLKDAAATAIYGSRGANGVIIVTTRKGKAGRQQLSYDGNFGYQSVLKKIDLLNAPQFATLRNAALFDANPAVGEHSYLSLEAISNLGEGTNWQESALRVGRLQNHQLGLAGGAEKIQYYLGANYLNQEGILINTDFQRFGLRTNIQAQPYQRLQVGTHLTINKMSGQIAPAGIVNALLLMPPTASIYDADGAYTLRNPFENIFANPIATLNEVENTSKTWRTLGTAFAQYKLLDGLHAKVLFGADINQKTDQYYLPSYIYEGNGNSGRASLGSLESLSWLNENTLTYDKAFAKHQLNVLVGFTQQEAQTSLFNAGAEGFVTDDLLYNNLQSGSTLLRPNSDAYKWVLHSYLARINYNYANTYYLSASIRRDGSSRFGTNNKWGNFPSLALSWRLINEPFLADLAPLLSDFKLRTSFGSTGNLEIGQYQSLSTLYALNYLFGDRVVPGFASQRIPNANLGWEKTLQYDAGIDIGLWKNRLSLTLDWYYKKTSDLLVDVEIPWTSGYATSLQNFGSVENKGVELSLKSTNLQGAFNWTSDFNISWNKNKVLALGNGADSYISGNYIIQVGQPLGTFYGTQVDGILQEGEVEEKGAFTGLATPKPGDRLYKDVDGDGQFTSAADRAIIGNAQPKFIFGLTNSLGYRNFDLTFLWQGSYGNEILNINRQNLEMFTGQQNASRDALDRWTPSRPSETYPRAKLDPAPIFSDQFLESGSFLRLKSLLFAYHLPKAVLDKLQLSQCRLYLQGQNLFTWSNYRGFDPEVTSGSNVQIGADAGIYPSSKSISFGASFTF